MNQSIPYREADHRGFDDEWLCHRGVSGWWYITGCLTDIEDPDRLYSYQATFIRARLFGITLPVLHLAVTDLSTGEHRFLQRIGLPGTRLRADETTVCFGDRAILTRSAREFILQANGDDFNLMLECVDAKGAVWHGENGVLVMGRPESRRDRTVYYSRTNLSTRGTIDLGREDGSVRKVTVTGKSWFDRQWGPFRIANPATHWEWFSLRFFDDEEIMLFTFPQHSYHDGTYVDRNGTGRRLCECGSEAISIVTVGKYRFSRGWKLSFPGVKEEHYQVVPLTDGQLNLSYFELLAEIKNPAGKRVGVCIVELLSGVRSPEAFNLSILRKV